MIHFLTDNIKEIAADKVDIIKNLKLMTHQIIVKVEYTFLIGSCFKVVMQNSKKITNK